VTKRQYLRETILVGPNAKREAEKAVTGAAPGRSEADAADVGNARPAPRSVLRGRHPASPRTRADYASRAAKHIRLLVGSTPIGRIDVFASESLCSELARCCRDHCHGRKFVDHRTSHPHVCDEHLDAGPCKPMDPACRACQRMCLPHRRRPLKETGIRAIHFIQWRFRGLASSVGGSQPARSRT
jgi:hypothetical protein